MYSTITSSSVLHSPGGPKSGKSVFQWKIRKIESFIPLAAELNAADNMVRSLMIRLEANGSR
jgi:hypothetical protein